MSDVFISYARTEVEVAGRFARALEEEGYSVFWDHRIPAGVTWSEVIEKELSEARSVIVLWSEESTKSPWVQEEANYALEESTLLPVIVGHVAPPLRFRSLQAVDLSNWDGRPSHPGFVELKVAIQRVARRAT